MGKALSMNEIKILLEVAFAGNVARVVGRGLRSATSIQRIALGSFANIIVHLLPDILGSDIAVTCIIAVARAGKNSQET